MRLLRFFSELKRRHVFRVAIAYAAAGFIVLQAADLVVPGLPLPVWTYGLVLVLVLLGFPVAVALAWAFDMTPSGMERTPALAQSPAPAAAGPGPAATVPLAAGAPVTVRADALATPKPPPRAPVRGSFPLKDFTIPRAAGAALDPPTPAPRPELDTGPPDPERVRRASLAHLRHELRTPINAIIGYSEMLIEDAEDAGERDFVADLGKVRAAGRQLLSLVDRILHPQRIEAPGADQDLEAFGGELRHELRTPITAVVGYAEMLIEGAREEGRDHLLPDLHRILDAARQLLGELDDIVRLSAAAAPRSADNGEMSRTAAMAQVVLAKLQPLSIVSAPDPDVGQASLLVVDDNPTNRDLLSRQLARQGFSVHTASHGREALERLGAEDFDLVLLDVMMPEIDGIEVLRRMKADPGLRDIPVIMISALDEIDSVVRCIQLGAADYLTKPFDPVLLQARIGASLEVRRLREDERRLAERLQDEREFSDWVLGGLVPAPLAERVREGTATPELFAEVTVLAVAIEDFKRLTSRKRGGGGVSHLAQLVSDFDRLARERELSPVPTSSDCYTVIAGAHPARPDHAEVIADLALAMSDAAAHMEQETGEAVRLQVGIHSGAVVAGVLPTERLVYGVWGEAVDTAGRLCARSGAGCIQVSPSTYARLQGRYRLASRGVVEVPGAGQMKTYLLQATAETVPPITD
jgi:adenylate cyclase